MSKLIAVINSKGGVGKTTTAVLLANELSRYGSVQLKDADMQGSATSWIEKAEMNQEIPFHFEITNRAQIAKNKERFAFTVVDTPPQDTMIMDAVIKVADYVIIPTSPTGLDLERVFEILNMMNDKPYSVLLTQVNTKTLTYRGAKTMLEDQNINLFFEPIPHREAIKRSFGTIPSELEAIESYGKIALNLLNIWNEENKND